MKKTILYAGTIAIIALTACNSAKTENTNETAATPAASGAPVVMDLENRGLDGLEVTITAPDSMSKKMTFAKSDYTGALDIMAGANYKMTIFSNFADEEQPIDSSLNTAMSTVKYNTDATTNKYIINEPRLFMWSGTSDKGTGYHFFAVFPDPKSKSTYYSFGDDEKTLHSEAAIRSMIEIAKTLKRK